MTDGSDRSRAWIGVLISALVLVTVLGIGGAAVGFFAARRAQGQAASMRDLAERSRAEAMEAMARAEEEERRAAAAVEFLQRSVTAPDPTKPADRAPDLREMLRAVAERLEKGEVKDPGLAASLHSTLGTTYESMGDNDRAVSHLRAALDLRKKALGDNAPEVAVDMENLARALRAQGDQGAPQSAPISPPK
jgi:hypothetical protein